MSSLLIEDNQTLHKVDLDTSEISGLRIFCCFLECWGTVAIKLYIREIVERKMRTYVNLLRMMLLIIVGEILFTRI